jgi:aspartyl-tRNA(Asn)/glutamyl-tRNA(Gln) amidotransferase subunit B
LLISDKPLCDLFEEGLKFTKNAKALCNWLAVEFTGRVKEMNRNLSQIGVKVQHVADLINMIDQGTITGKIAKSVADDMVAKPGTSPKEIVDLNPDYKPIDNSDEIEKMVDEVISENPASIEDFKLGKDKAFNFLVGQVMKMCKGKASPTLVRDIMLKKMSS